MKKVKVYGADWCPVTTQALKHLRQLRVPFEYINIERDPAAAEWVKRHHNGKEVKPTIDIDGLILSEPSDQELETAVLTKLIPT
jgi:glutaredoxin